MLEDDPRFNAGTGACLTSAETLDLDASIMEGRGLRAGAVCGLSPFRSPITDRPNEPIIMVSRSGDLGIAKNTKTMSWAQAREDAPSRCGF